MDGSKNAGVSGKQSAADTYSHGAILTKTRLDTYKNDVRRKKRLSTIMRSKKAGGGSTCLRFYF